MNSAIGPGRGFGVSPEHPGIALQQREYRVGQNGGGGKRSFKGNFKHGGRRTSFAAATTAQVSSSAFWYSLGSG